MSEETDKSTNITTNTVYTRKKTPLRWLALFLASMMAFGTYFCFDNPQALQQSIQDFFDINNTQFNLLYTTYAIPNIILPFFGGIIIDKIGVRLAGFIFGIFPILGQMIIIYAVNNKDYFYMLVGRIVSGAGGDTLLVAQAAILTKWFNEKELSLAMGVALNISSVGSSINSVISPMLAAWYDSLAVPLEVGFIFCVVSWLSIIALNLIDKTADVKEDYDEEPENDEKFQFKDLKKFSGLFYLLLLEIIIMDGAFLSFMANSNDLLVERFGFNQSSAGLQVSIIYFFSLICSPIFGYLTGKHGKRATMLLLALLMFIASQLFLSFLSSPSPGEETYLPIVGLLGISLYDAVVSSVAWPGISIIVDEGVLGSAYGLITSLANLMVCIIPIITGKIHDASVNDKEGYFWTGIEFAVLGFICFIITMFVYKSDKRSGRRLELVKIVEENTVLITNDLRAEPLAILEPILIQSPVLGPCLTPPILRPGMISKKVTPNQSPLMRGQKNDNLLKYVKQVSFESFKLDDELALTENS